MPVIGRAFSAISKNSLISNFRLSSIISSGVLRFSASVAEKTNSLKILLYRTDDCDQPAVITVRK
jgi:hypothetical protein